jgi:hypothetical protein
MLSTRCNNKKTPVSAKTKKNSLPARQNGVFYKME